MDTKKNLKPELKEIYERVMSTKSAPRTSTPPPAPTKPSNTPAAPEPTQVKREPVQPPPQSPQANPEQYLSSTAPRAVNTSDTFVFSSHGKSTPPPKKEDKKEEHSEVKVAEVKPATGSAEKGSNPETKKKSSMMPVLLALMGIFVVIYTIFWVFYFGLI